MKYREQPTPQHPEHQTEILLNTALKHIMTPETYATIEHETPYLFELTTQDKALTYFGSSHSNNPHDLLFSKIQTAFERATPDLVIVEGFTNLPTDTSQLNKLLQKTPRETVIKKSGEPGFTCKLAAEHTVEWMSPEPNDAAVYTLLRAKGFSQKEIFAWSVFLTLPHYQRAGGPTDFKTYVAEAIEQFKRATQWEQFDYSYEHALAIGENIVGRTLAVEHEPNPTDLIDPIPWAEKKEQQTVLNTIGSCVTQFRDKKIVSAIYNAFKSHQRIFVVYGASHAVMQEPALRKAFEIA